ncbi:MAG TPA: stage II sporulation protein E [Deltaproteobacteria bacterium]|nr:stage II sporulation protein E [Deltaproteobacteria bacterium]
MHISIPSSPSILIDLIRTGCVVMVFAYLLSRTRFFTNLLDKISDYKTRIVTILLFGALSIFGTYGGITLETGAIAHIRHLGPAGAIANIRDLGPIVAGLVGGPIIGLGAGLIGGVHRYLLGGFLAVPCAIATVLAGLIGGLVYSLRKGNFPRIWQVMLLALGTELMHIGLVLLISKPFDDVLAVVQEVTVPMVVANVIGAGIFAFIICNEIGERNTSADKEKYRRELERKTFELETARNIQQTLLPESPPRLEGFDMAAFSLPALEVGGDFYDFIPLSQNKWGLVVADVSGKGFPAALFMALSRTYVRANAVGKATASEAISMANSLIAKDAKSGMFVTLFYAMLDAKKKQLRYVNAGHNPPLLAKGCGGDVVLLCAQGIALGVMDEIDLQEVELDLADNDVVVFYTDGVTEAINGKEEEFGQERLIELVAQNSNLSAQELIDKIKEAVIEFAQGQAQFDDLTLLVLKSLRVNYEYQGEQSRIIPQG